MLQQTRVAAATEFYRRFMERYPDFHELAKSTEEELLRYWAGLGYYYRARNLWAAAKSMSAGGGFPFDYDAIRRLPGVGDYTAAAVASIAFDLPHAVLDGNVFRVLSRLTADATDIGSGNGRKHFGQLAQSLLDCEAPGDYNQAIMELGATVCLPRNPQCLLCPAAALCPARAQGTQHLFPVKKLKNNREEEIRTLLWVEQGSKILGWQRPADSRLMPGFWELPEAEHLPESLPGATLGSFRHGITIHNYRFQVVEASVPAALDACVWLNLEKLAELPISTVFRKALGLLRKHRNPRYAVHVAR